MTHCGHRQRLAFIVEAFGVADWNTLEVSLFSSAGEFQIATA